MAIVTTTLTIPTGTHTLRITASGGPITVSGVEAVSAVPVPHTIRVQGQDGSLPTTPLGAGLVELGPGADIPTATAASSAGSLSIRGRLPLPAAAAVAVGGAVAAPARVGLPAATGSSEGGVINWLGGTITSHTVRFSPMVGSSIWAVFVPGADAPGASATASAGSIGLSATIGLPAATAVASAGSLTGAGVAIPAATATTSAGSIGRSGRLALPWAESYVSAGWISSGVPLPAATAASGAGAVAISALVPLPAGSIHQLPMFIGGGSTEDLPPGRIRNPRAYVIDPLPPQPVAPKAVSSVPAPVAGKASST